MLCFLLPFSPQYLHGRYSFPSPESRPRSAPTAPRSPLPRLPRTCPQSHGPRLCTPRIPGTPAARLAIPTVCVASWSRRIPASRPPTAHAPAPLPPSYPLNRLRAVHATPVFCLVVWVVPAVHSRPPGFLGIFRGV